MKLTINNTEKLPHLEREEITATIEFEGNTPSRKEIRKSLADKQGAKQELVFIRNIYTEFGDAKAKVMACVYSSQKAMEKVEQNYMVEKHKIEAEESADSEDETKGDGEDSSGDEGASDEQEEDSKEEEDSGEDSEKEEDSDEDDSDKE